jgi:transposase
MNKTVTVTRRGSIKSLKKAIRQSSDEGQKTRIRVIIKSKKGVSCGCICDDFHIAPNSVRNWIRAYNSNGIEGLATNRGGRPKGSVKWEDDIFKKLGKAIEDEPNTYWSLKKMQQWITEDAQKNIPIVTLWKRITANGYTHKSARPTPVKGDKKTQETFKKGGL